MSIFGRGAPGPPRETRLGRRVGAHSAHSYRRRDIRHSHAVTACAARSHRLGAARGAPQRAARRSRQPLLRGEQDGRGQHRLRQLGVDAAVQTWRNGRVRPTTAQLTGTLQPATQRGCAPAKPSSRASSHASASGPSPRADAARPCCRDLTTKIGYVDSVATSLAAAPAAKTALAAGGAGRRPGPAASALRASTRAMIHSNNDAFCSPPARRPRHHAPAQRRGGAAAAQRAPRRRNTHLGVDGSRYGLAHKPPLQRAFRRVLIGPGLIRCAAAPQAEHGAGCARTRRRNG